MEFVAIIPARYASTRFPAKPLAVLGGKPVIIRVCEQANKVFSHVFVATDDNRIYDAVEAGGFKAVMTRQDHKSGTDRCYEAFPCSYIDIKKRATLKIALKTSWGAPITFSRTALQRTWNVSGSCGNGYQTLPTPQPGGRR